jgi:hypothetical protein
VPPTTAAASPHSVRPSAHPTRPANCTCPSASWRPNTTAAKARPDNTAAKVRPALSHYPTIPPPNTTAASASRPLSPIIPLSRPRIQIPAPLPLRSPLTAWRDGGFGVVRTSYVLHGVLRSMGLLSHYPGKHNLVQLSEYRTGASACIS